jgi:hypothetical protein
MHEHRAAYCWRIANKARMAQEEAKQNVVVGYLVGGLIGALITSSQHGEAYETDRWRQAYDRCMARRHHPGDDDD